MKKYRFFIWGMALFLFACGNENTKNPVEEEILPFRAAYEMSSRDSSFFYLFFSVLLEGNLFASTNLMIGQIYVRQVWE